MTDTTEPIPHPGSPTPADGDAQPPVAKQVPATRIYHGDTVVDAYAWLRDRDDPDTLAYLQAENAYCAAMTARLSPLQDTIFAEIKAHTQETDVSAPVRQGGWWYYSRTEVGKQYPIHCRRRSGDEVEIEQVLVDGNALAGDSPFFALGHLLVSPDGGRLAFSTNYDGGESYTVRFKELATGDLLHDEIPGAYYSGAWSSDGSTFFYVTHDAAMRPYRIWRHRLGTAASNDVLLREEADERFFASVRLTRSERFVVLELHSQVTSEIWTLPADMPEATARVVEPRRQGVEYAIAHQGERLFILHNDGAVNFALAAAPVDAPGHANWQPVMDGSETIRLLGIQAFAGHLVVSLRADGRTGLRILPLAEERIGPAYDIDFPEPVYTVRPGDNRQYATVLFRLQYTSLTTPASVYDYDMSTRTLILKKQQSVLGGYNAEQYQSAREWAAASDGTAVPLSLVWRKGTPRDGTAPCLLYGYGSYEASMDPTFSIPRLALLDRGFLYAIAHIRGGGELGRRWYEEGKLLRKRNSFTDYIACADALIAGRWTAPDRLVGRGGSAGGLLIGAVANLAPERFRALVAEVPFVDALNTILDPTLPLTVIEWEEWGNPLADAETYRYMRSYSPYENVEAKVYPALLVTTGLNDPRVGYHEPAKWVARLRATKTDSNLLLLKTALGAGHGGKSGRYDAWQEEAFVLAFIIDAVSQAAETAPPLAAESPAVRNRNWRIGIDPT